MPLKNPFRVSIDHETGMSARVQQQAVCRFRPDAMDGQQSLANHRSFSSKKLFQITIERLYEHAQEGTQPARLDIEITGRPDQFRQF